MSAEPPAVAMGAPAPTLSVSQRMLLWNFSGGFRGAANSRNSLDGCDGCARPQCLFTQRPLGELICSLVGFLSRCSAKWCGVL